MQRSEITLYQRYHPHNIPPNSNVSVVGLILNLDEAKHRLILQVDQQNKQTVEVQLPSTFECAELRHLRFIEVRGRTRSSKELLMHQYCNFKDNFDLKTYNEVMALAADSTFRNVFGFAH